MKGRSARQTSSSNNLLPILLLLAAAIGLTPEEVYSCTRYGKTVVVNVIPKAAAPAAAAVGETMSEFDGGSN